MRAALYARVSTFDQEPENQLQELRRYAEARGWTPAEYVDRGVSGAKDRRHGHAPLTANPAGASQGLGHRSQVLNIFLRGCVLQRVPPAQVLAGTSEGAMAIPLDSITSTELRHRDASLPLECPRGSHDDHGMAPEGHEFRGPAGRSPRFGSGETHDRAAQVGIDSGKNLDDLFG